MRKFEFVNEWVQSKASLDLKLDIASELKALEHLQ